MEETESEKQREDSKGRRREKGEIIQRQTDRRYTERLRTTRKKSKKIETMSGNTNNRT